MIDTMTPLCRYHTATLERITTNGRVEISLVLNLKFETKKNIAAGSVGVSRCTIKRRLREYGISIRGRQTDIPDAELVRYIQTEFPNAGCRRMQSRLSYVE